MTRRKQAVSTREAGRRGGLARAAGQSEFKRRQIASLGGKASALARVRKKLLEVSQAVQPLSGMVHQAQPIENTGSYGVSEGQLPTCAVPNGTLHKEADTE